MEKILRFYRENVRESVRETLTPVTHTSSTTQQFVRTLEFYPYPYIEIFYVNILKNTKM